MVWLFLFTCIYWWGAGPIAAALCERWPEPPPSLLQRGAGLPLPALRPGHAVSRSADRARACDVCGLDLRAHDAGDGAAVGVILVLGAIVVGTGILGRVPFLAAAVGARGAVAGGDSAAGGA